MAQDERDFILQSAMRVEWHESVPRPLDEAYCDMTPQELIGLAETLQRMLRESEAARNESEKRYDRLLTHLAGLNENIRTLTDALKERDCRLAEKDRMIEELRKTVQDSDGTLV